MKEDGKKILREWKKSLEHLLDPLDMMDSLPREFPIGSPAYIRVISERKNHNVAVGILIDEASNKDMLFDDFIVAIRESGHHWLATLVSGKIEDYEVEEAILQHENISHLQDILTLISPHIRATIIAKDVAERLLYDRIISKENLELIERETINHGNLEAVRVMLSILVRKPLGWWKNFVHTIDAMGYDIDLVDSLHSLTASKTVQYASSDIVEEHELQEDASKPDHGGTVRKRASIGANIFPGSSVEIEKNPNVHSQSSIPLRKDQESMVHEAIRRKNVIICAPRGSGKTKVAAYIIDTKGWQRQDPKIAFIVRTAALAKQKYDEIKTLLKGAWNIDYLIGDKKTTLKSALQSHNVIVMTPQILINSLHDGSLHSLKQFSMIVFDECHHTIKQDPYNKIMSRYLNMKDIEGDRDLPQIIGIADTVDVGDSTDNVLRLCANLDAFGGIVTVPIVHKEELNYQIAQEKDDTNVNNSFTEGSNESQSSSNTSITTLMEKTRDIIKKMYETDLNKYVSEIIRLQQEAFNSAKLKELQIEDNTNGATISKRFRVHCRKCNEQICMNDDIEILETVHTFDDIRFKNTFIRRLVEHGGTEEKYGLFCIKCESQFGIFDRFKDITTPRLKPDGLMFIDESNPTCIVKSGQWRSIKIGFSKISYQDLAERQILNSKRRV